MMATRPLFSGIRRRGERPLRLRHRWIGFQRSKAPTTREASGQRFEDADSETDNRKSHGRTLSERKCRRGLAVTPMLPNCLMSCNDLLGSLSLLRDIAIWQKLSVAANRFGEDQSALPERHGRLNILGCWS